MVIYGHAYEISPEPGKSDFIRNLIEFDYTGSLAVKIFFFISGLVVANSLMKKQNISEYIVSRFFRIWPALMTAILLSYIFAFLFTSLNHSEFIDSTPPINYIISSFFLNITWSFPGVFDSNTINVFNGSLWSIVYEVGCYIVLLSIAGLCGYKRTAITVVCLVLITDSIFGYLSIFTEALSREEVRYLPAIFALGVLAAVNKDRIDINKETSALLILLTTIFYSQQSSLYVFSFYVTLMYVIIYISSDSLFIKLKPKHDISYGVYLYGFPVQQTVYSCIKATGAGILSNQIISIAISIIIGLCSWLVIERRFVKYGRYIQDKINDQKLISHKN